MTREELAELNPDMLFVDGFDEALVGVCTQFSRHLALYDHRKCVEILVKRDGMTEEEAEEYMSFNVTGAWMGENTPVFMYPKEPE